MELYQVFDQEGKDVGVVSAISPFDAVRKVREQIGSFPMVIQLEGKRAELITSIIRKQHALEGKIEKFILAEIAQFERETNIKVNNMDVILRHEVVTNTISHVMVGALINLKIYTEK